LQTPIRRIGHFKPKFLATERVNFFLRVLSLCDEQREDCAYQAKAGSFHKDFNGIFPNGKELQALVLPNSPCSVFSPLLQTICFMLLNSFVKL